MNDNNFTAKSVLTKSGAGVYIDAIKSFLGAVPSLRIIKELLNFFGGEDAEVTVEEVNNDGHSGKGLYVFFDEYPEEGSVFLGRS
ncbi:MAG: hypothetical protein HZA00_09815 [Nitrospinae bacterium]|nr:hypothetical protein [Nitrospinota bacterium]